MVTVAAALPSLPLHLTLDPSVPLSTASLPHSLSSLNIDNNNNCPTSWHPLIKGLLTPNGQQTLRKGLKTWLVSLYIEKMTCFTYVLTCLWFDLVRYVH